MMLNFGRKFLDSHLRHVIRYRDWYIATYGQSVQVAKPTSESRDVFGDRSPIDVENLSKMPLLFNWQEYNELLSYDTVSTHENVPVKALARVKDNIPQGSVVKVQYFSADGVDVQDMYFIVTNIRVLHNVIQYARELTLSPYRGSVQWR